MAKKKKIKRRLKILSRTSNLAALRNFVEKFSFDCGFGEEEIQQIILAADEACTNIIKHAYKFSPSGEITLDAECDGEKLSLVFTDSGAPFNPDAIPEPDINELSKRKKVGGLGIYLMKKLMDEVRYKINREKNQVILIKKKAS